VLTDFKDDPLVPLHLLVWSVETVMSTLTCAVEAANWEGFSNDEQIALAQLYVPYLALGTLWRNRSLSDNRKIVDAFQNSSRNGA
jgi:hypothetical protein